MKILFGLGNPGKAYARTRHTVGAQFIEWLAKNLDISLKEHLRAKNRIGRANERGRTIMRVTLAVSGCWMNESGRCAKALLSTLKAKPADLWVFHDDSDLDFGKVKISIGRGAAGHHGVESLFSALKTKNFRRVRIGVRPKEEFIRKKAGDFILKPFSKREETALPKVFEHLFALLKKEFARED